MLNGGYHQTAVELHSRLLMLCHVMYKNRQSFNPVTFLNNQQAQWCKKDKPHIYIMISKHAWEDIISYLHVSHVLIYSVRFTAYSTEMTECVWIKLNYQGGINLYTTKDIRVQNTRLNVFKIKILTKAFDRKIHDYIYICRETLS